MSVDQAMIIEDELKSTELRKRIKSALMTAFELGAIDPDSSLANKEELLTGILDDIFRDHLNECGAV